MRFTPIAASSNCRFSDKRIWAPFHFLPAGEGRTLEDALARRTRALFLNAHAAIRMAPRAAELLAQEIGKDKAWQFDQVEQFTKVAQGYLVKQ